MGCIEFRGKGENRQGLLIWTDEILRESNWVPLCAITAGLPRGGTGPAPHRLLLEQRVDKNSAWSVLDAKHEEIVDGSPRWPWRWTTPRCRVWHGVLCTFPSWAARLASSTT